MTSCERILALRTASRRSHHNHSGHCHVAVKVCSRESDPIRRELAAFEYLNNLPRTEHHGRHYIRTSLDKFELTAPSNGSLQTFQCFVFEPMAESVWTFRHDCWDWKLPEWLVKVIIQHVLIALDYLHRHAKVIHAGSFAFSHAHCVLIRNSVTRHPREEHSLFCERNRCL